MHVFQIRFLRTVQERLRDRLVLPMQQELRLAGGGGSPANISHLISSHQRSQPLMLWAIVVSFCDAHLTFLRTEICGLTEMFGLATSSPNHVSCL